MGSGQSMFLWVTIGFGVAIGLTAPPIVVIIVSSFLSLVLVLGIYVGRSMTKHSYLAGFFAYLALILLLSIAGAYFLRYHLLY